MINRITYVKEELTNLCRIGSLLIKEFCYVGSYWCTGGCPNRIKMFRWLRKFNLVICKAKRDWVKK